MLLPQESNAVDHLLRSGTRGIEAVGEPRVLFLEELNTLGGHHSLYARRLQAFDARLGLQSTAAEGCELVTKMLDQHLQLRERGYFRTYAV
jgi:hypothetical protein